MSNNSGRNQTGAKGFADAISSIENQVHLALHAAIASLPNKQAKRIYAHFILGMTKQDIARAEGVHEKVVRVAIERGLRRLEKILKNSL